jgi:hypothetical protein
MDRKAVDIQELKEFYEITKSISKCSKHFGRSRQYLRKLFHENGIETDLQPQKIHFELSVEDAKRMYYDEELGYEQIGDIVGAPTNQIMKFFDDNKLEPRNPHAKKYLPPEKELRDLYERMQQIDIARLYNVSPRVVSLRFEEYGIEKRSHAENAIEFTVPKVEKTNFEIYGVRTPLLLPEFQKTMQENNTDRGSNSESIGEKETREFLNSLGCDFQKTREIINGELDGYDDNLKIAFEFNGTWYHCEYYNKYKDYHIKKTRDCLEKNIRLVHIFEDEWNTRNEQCKNFLRSLVGKNSRKIYARNCEIKIIDKIMASKFINKHHIQPISSKFIKYAYGLFYKDELVGCMTFGRHHRQNSSSDNIILNRLVFLPNTTVVGASSKLLKYAIKEFGEKYSNIISWSDNRWSLGNVYIKMGFLKEKEYSRKEYQNNR